MYKVNVTKRVIEKIQKYIKSYRWYHEDLYLDSGVWNEELIIDGYFQEAKNRYKEIRFTLENKISQAIPSYLNNQAIIRWRSKILVVSFRERDDTRIITDLEIR